MKKNETTPDDDQKFIKGKVEDKSNNTSNKKNDIPTNTDSSKLNKEKSTDTSKKIEIASNSYSTNNIRQNNESDKVSVDNLNENSGDKKKVNINSNKEVKDTKESTKDPNEKVKKEDLIIKLKEYEEKLKYERDEKKKLMENKNKELETKDKVIFSITGTNKKLMTELEDLKKEVDEKLDKIGMKQLKESEKDKEQKKKQAPLEQLLKVKEKELKNAMTMIEIYKKDKGNLEKSLKETGNLDQYISLQDKLKVEENKNSELESQIKAFQKLKEEHEKCEEVKCNIEKEKTQLMNEMKYLKDKNRDLKLKIRQEEQKLIKSAEVKNKQINNLNTVPNKQENNVNLPNINNNTNQTARNQGSSKVKEENTANSLKRKGSPNNEKEYRKYLSQERQKFSISIQSKNFKGLTDNDSSNSKLLTTEEKNTLTKYLPANEVTKLEKKFETIELAKNSLDRKFLMETKTLNKKIVDLQGRLDMIILENNESEQKNKILSFQINEHKNENKIFSRKVIELNKNLRDSKKNLAEQEEENKKLIKVLQEIRRDEANNNSRSYKSGVIEESRLKEVDSDYVHEDIVDADEVEEQEAHEQNESQHSQDI